MRIKRVSYVGMRTSDVEGMTRFFRDVLGLEPVGEDETVTFQRLPTHRRDLVEVYSEKHHDLRLIPDEADFVVAFAVDDIREAMAEMRRLVGILDEADGPGARPQPGLPQLPELLDRVREAGLTVEFEAEGDVSDLPGGLNLAAYRVVQEALTNVMKHAGASAVRVRIGRSCGALTIDVVDDGRGCRPREDGGGRGLIGMRQRVALYGGRIDVGSQPGGGFSINVVIPLEGATA